MPKLINKCSNLKIHIDTHSCMNIYYIMSMVKTLYNYVNNVLFTVNIINTENIGHIVYIYILLNLYTIVYRFNLAKNNFVF